MCCPRNAVLLRSQLTLAQLVVEDDRLLQLTLYQTASQYSTVVQASLEGNVQHPSCYSVASRGSRGHLSACSPADCSGTYKSRSDGDVRYVNFECISVQHQFAYGSIDLQTASSPGPYKFLTLTSDLIPKPGSRPVWVGHCTASIVSASFAAHSVPESVLGAALPWSPGPEHHFYSVQSFGSEWESANLDLRSVSTPACSNIWIDCLNCLL